MSDPEKRSQYDQFGHAAFDGGAAEPADLADSTLTALILATFSEISLEICSAAVQKRRKQWSDERSKYPKECPNHI